MKALDQPYVAGRRGTGWLKVKPRAHARPRRPRRRVGPRPPARAGCPTSTSAPATPPAGGFVMLGKTFKGLTDEMLAWQTERLLELEVAATPTLVHVRPELVVEIAFDGIQTQPALPGWRRPALRPRVAPPARQDARRRPTRSTPCSASVQPDAAVRSDRPVRVVGDLPRVTVRVDEDRGVAAPEGLGRLGWPIVAPAARASSVTASTSSREPTLWARRHAARRRRHPRHSCPRRVSLGPRAPAPFARLEEDDVVIGRGTGLPAEGLVEAARTAEIALRRE